MCCKDVTTTTSRIEDVKDVLENTIETKENGEIEAEPSNIDEVVVKITGEAVEVILYYHYNPC